MYVAVIIKANTRRKRVWGVWESREQRFLPWQRLGTSEVALLFMKTTLGVTKDEYVLLLLNVCATVSKGCRMCRALEVTGRRIL
jgi:hypothetical protein